MTETWSRSSTAIPACSVGIAPASTTISAKNGYCSKSPNRLLESVTRRPETDRRPVGCIPPADHRRRFPGDSGDHR